jgi:hypothetical protein
MPNKHPHFVPEFLAHVESLEWAECLAHKRAKCLAHNFAYNRAD